MGRTGKQGAHPRSNFYFLDFMILLVVFLRPVEVVRVLISLILSLPANGWAANSIPIPRPEMSCDKVVDDINVGTPLSFSTTPCRATVDQMAGFLDTFVEVDDEILSDPEIINFYTISLLQVLPTMPLEYKKLFAPVGGFQSANQYVPFVDQAHAAAPIAVYALRAALIVLKQGIRKASAGAPANIIALLQGGTTSRYPPEQIFGSIAYLLTRLDGSSLCDGCKTLNEHTDTVLQDMGTWFAGVGLAAKGAVNEEDIERKVCTLSGNAHGKANELVITAAYHSLYEFGSALGISDPNQYQILLSDPREGDDIIEVGLMTNQGGKKKLYDGAPQQRKPDLVLFGSGRFERIWVETKSWRYNLERKYLNKNGKDLNKSIFKPWDGVSQTKTYTTMAHRQHFLDYAASQDALADAYWEKEKFGAFKPVEHVTWVQVWEKGARRWNALVKKGKKYELEKEETVRNVATPWISEKGIVKNTTPEFRALQRFLSEAPDGMNSYAFKTSIGYSLKEHEKRYVNKQVTTSFADLKQSTVRPFTLATFYALAAGEGAVAIMQEKLQEQFGGGAYAEVQKAIKDGSLNKEQVEALRDRVMDDINEVLGPFEYLLVEIPGLSWLEDKAADAVLGDEVERLRDSMANLEVPFADELFENICESP
jgi:hypothetical protein